MSGLNHCCGILLMTLACLITSEATAASIPIDLNNFVPFPDDPAPNEKVKIASDGSSADFKESIDSAIVLLTNDPFVGDPFVIVPGPSTFLTFDFTFDKATQDEDTFSAYLFLAQDGPLSGVLDQFSVSNTQAGTVNFDLSDYVAGQEVLVLGLQFELFDLTGGSLDSTATISNLALTQVVPIPAAIWLFGSGLLALTGIARRMKA